MDNLFLIVTVGPDYRLLPRFLRWYTALGVRNFLVILNTQDTSPIHILRGYGITAQHSWYDPFSEQAKQLRERNILLKCCSDEDWVLYADLDEFQYYPFGLKNHISYCTENGIDFLEGHLIDRISKTGELIDIVEDRTLGEQFPLGGLLTKNLLKAWDKKIVLAKAKLTVGGGHHVFLEDTTHKPLPYKTTVSKHSLGIEVHHFKWDKKILLRFKDYLNLKDSSLQYWQKEILRFLKHYTKYHGVNIKDKRFCISDVKKFINI